MRSQLPVIAAIIVILLLAYGCEKAGTPQQQPQEPLDTIPEAGAQAVPESIDDGLGEALAELDLVG